MLTLNGGIIKEKMNLLTNKQQVYQLAKYLLALGILISGMCMAQVAQAQQEDTFLPFITANGDGQSNPDPEPTALPDEGEDVPILSASDMPIIETDAVSGELQITVPSTPSPTESSMTVLAAGTGPVVTAGAEVTLKYEMVNWNNGRLVESSDSFEAPFSMFVGEGLVPAYLDNVIIGQTEGSKLMVVLGKGTPDLPGALSNNSAYALSVEIVDVYQPELALSAAAAVAEYERIQAMVAIDSASLNNTPTVGLSLGGIIYNDLNRNGVQDSNELGIRNVNVLLYADTDGDNWPDGSHIAKANTGLSGNYLFTALEPGDYVTRISPWYFRGDRALSNFMVCEQALDEETGAPAAAIDPDNDQDGDNNGIEYIAPSTRRGARTLAITLETGSEPTSEDGDADTNLTLDYCVHLGAIDTPVLPNGEPDLQPLAVDDEYVRQVNTSLSANILENDTAGNGPLLIRFLSGDVAPGLTLTPDGDLIGTVTQLGVYVFDYEISDYDGDSSTATVTVTVQSDLFPDAVDDSNAVNAGDPLTMNICINDDMGDGFGALDYISGDVAPGLTLNGCTLSGVPTTGGQFVFTYELTDTDGDTDRATVTIDVNLLPIAVDDSTVGAIGTPFNFDICTNDYFGDGFSAVTFDANALPPGLSQTGCIISGTPTTTGTYPFPYELSDVDGDTDTATVEIEIPALPPNLLPDAIDDYKAIETNLDPAESPVSFTYDICANDYFGDGFASVTQVNGTLPPGTTLNDCILSGGITEGGTFVFDYELTDTNGDSDIATVTIYLNLLPNAVDDPVTTTIVNHLYSNSCGNNLIQNSGFEDGSSYWIGQNTTVYTTQGYEVEGNRYGYIGGNSGNAKLYQEIDNIAPNTTLQLLFAGGSHQPIPYEHSVYIEFYNQNGQLLGTSSIVDVDYDVENPPNRLQDYALSVVTPANTDHIRVVGRATGDTLKLDEMCLEIVGGQSSRDPINIDSLNLVEIVGNGNTRLPNEIILEVGEVFVLEDLLTNPCGVDLRFELIEIHGGPLVWESPQFSLLDLKAADENYAVYKFTTVESGSVTAATPNGIPVTLTDVTIEFLDLDSQGRRDHADAAGYAIDTGSQPISISGTGTAPVTFTRGAAPGSANAPSNSYIIYATDPATSGNDDDWYDEPNTNIRNELRSHVFTLNYDTFETVTYIHTAVGSHSSNLRRDFLMYISGPIGCQTTNPEETYTVIEGEFSIDICRNDFFGDGFQSVEIIAGDLGTDFSLDACTFSGRPTEPGSYTFEYELTDIDGDVDTAFITVNAEAEQRFSPIAIDLSNQGSIERVDGLFDIDITGDGKIETLAEWFAPETGILIDTRVHGDISGHHLFGDMGGTYTDGFEKLAQLDVNHDGRIAGTELNGLAIWTDVNSNAKVDSGEVSTLASHDIVSLSTNHADLVSMATLTDGSTLYMEDLWFMAAVTP